MSRLKELETWFWFYLMLIASGVGFIVLAQVIRYIEQTSPTVIYAVPRLSPFHAEMIGAGLSILGFTLIALNIKEFLKCRNNEQ